MLLLGVVGADLVDGRPFTPQQRHLLSRHVQLVNASEAVLIPEQEVLIVAKAEGVVQLLPLIHRLANQKTEQQDYTFNLKLQNHKVFLSLSTVQLFKTLNYLVHLLVAKKAIEQHY